MAKYTIRKPFAVHLEKFVDEEGQNGGKIRRLQQQSFFPGTPVELSDEDALAHLHKLEPADTDAKKFVGAFHAKQDEDRAARTAEVDDPDLDARVAAAVKTALEAQAAAGSKK